MNELRNILKIDEWLYLIEEDKNLNGAYISFGQYMYLLEKKLEAYENMRKEARIFIKIHGHYDIEIGRITLELTDDELTDLLNILNKVGDNK